MYFLLENAQVQMIYNSTNNAKKQCSVECMNKVVNDANRDSKLRLCKAQCGVQFDKEYLIQLQKLIATTKDPHFKQTIVSKIQFARKRLQGSMKRVIIAKQMLHKRLTTLPADLSMRVAKPSPMQQEG